MGTGTSLCWFLCPGQEKKKGGSATSLTGVGNRQRVFEVLWNLECPIKLSQKRNMAVVCAILSVG